MASQDANPGQNFPLQLPGQEFEGGLGSKGGMTSTPCRITGFAFEREFSDFFITAV